jgi:hypothetical protein
VSDEGFNDAGVRLRPRRDYGGVLFYRTPKIIQREAYLFDDAALLFQFGDDFRPGRRMGAHAVFVQQRTFSLFLGRFLAVRFRVLALGFLLPLGCATATRDEEQEGRDKEER